MPPTTPRGGSVEGEVRALQSANDLAARKTEEKRGGGSAKSYGCNWVPYSSGKITRKICSIWASEVEESAQSWLQGIMGFNHYAGVLTASLSVS